MISQYLIGVLIGFPLGFGACIIFNNRGLFGQLFSFIFGRITGKKDKPVEDILMGMLEGMLSDIKRMEKKMPTANRPITNITNNLKMKRQRPTFNKNNTLNGNLNKESFKEIPETQMDDEHVEPDEFLKSVLDEVYKKK